MNNEADWLNELAQLHETDKAAQAAKEAQRQQAAQAQQEALNLVQNSRAHELLRQVQRAFLKGEGMIMFLEKSAEFEQALVLAWDGPISAAQKPKKMSKNTTRIIVGVRGKTLWVNGKEVSKPSMATLKQALLAECRAIQKSQA